MYIEAMQTVTDMHEMWATCERVISARPQEGGRTYSPLNMHSHDLVIVGLAVNRSRPVMVTMRDYLVRTAGLGLKYLYDIVREWRRHLRGPTHLGCTRVRVVPSRCT